MADKTLSISDVDKWLKEKKGGNVGDPTKNATRPAIMYGTGVPNIDYALGGGTGELGGFPSGHVSEIYGLEATGKTSLLYRAIARAQEIFPNKVNILFDYEHTTDKRYIAACGVTLDKSTLRIFRPRTLEEGIELLIVFLKTGQLGIAAFDSLAAMMPAKDLKRREEDLEAVNVASKAKIMSEILKYLAAEIAATESHVSFINHQIANIISNPYEPGYKPSKVTPGGGALKYYAALRCELSFKGMINDDKRKNFEGGDYKGAIGKEIQLFVEKFKFGNPHSKTTYRIISGEGIDMFTPLIDGGVSRKLVTKAQAMYSLNLKGYEDQKFRGKETLRAFLKANSQATSALYDAIISTADQGFTEASELSEDATVPEVSFDD